MTFHNDVLSRLKRLREQITPQPTDGFDAHRKMNQAKSQINDLIQIVARDALENGRDEESSDA